MANQSMKYLSILIVLILFCTQAFADSYYSSFGIGLPKYYISTKSVGMGGTGLAIIDPKVLNAGNPAAIDIQGITTIMASYQYISSDNKTAFDKVNTRTGDPIGFRFALPVKNSLTFIAALKPLTVSNYYFEVTSAEELEYTRKIRGNGGVNSAQLGLKLNITPKLMIGANWNYNFATFSEEWRTDIHLTDYRDTLDELNSNMTGFNFDLGLVAMPVNGLSLGFVFSGESSLDGDTELSSNIGDKDFMQSISVLYPQSFGIGVAYLYKKLMFAADYYQQFWSKFELNGQQNSLFTDLKRIGGGIEFTESQLAEAKYRRRISYRIGAYFMQLPITDVENMSINERFISLGLGFPFFNNTGRVDFAFEIGKRGSTEQHLYEETILRFTGSITGGEKWFVRGR